MRLFRSAFEHSVALVLAILLGSLMIVGIGENPIVTYATLIDGAFGNPQRIAGTLLQSTPIMIAGMAACIAFRSGLFNIGVEGQLYMGGFAAALIGFSLPLPWFLHLPLAVVAAVIAALLANANPLLTVITALFFGMLRSGSLLLEVDTTMSREIITVLQSLIILCVSAQVRIDRRGDASAGERHDHCADECHLRHARLDHLARYRRPAAGSSARCLLARRLRPDHQRLHSAGLRRLPDGTGARDPVRARAAGTLHQGRR